MTALSGCSASDSSASAEAPRDPCDARDAGLYAHDTTLKVLKYAASSDIPPAYKWKGYRLREKPGCYFGVNKEIAVANAFGAKSNRTAALDVFYDAETGKWDTADFKLINPVTGKYEQY